METVKLGTRNIRVPKKQKDVLDALEHDYRIIGRTEGGTLVLEVPKHVDRTERRIVTDTGQVR